jgi:hypothetical protein
MNPLDLPNPFRKQQVGNEWAPPPGSVPDLHRPVLDICRRLARDVRGSADGTSLLVRGPQGSGKTHLTTQLRADLADDPAAVVVRVPLTNTYTGQVWRSTRAGLVGELLRKGWHPRQPDLTGLYRLVKNRFPDWDSGGFIRILSPKPAVELQQLLVQFAHQTGFSYELRQVLPRVYDADPGTAAAAADWLRGRQLADTDLKRLGLPPAQPSDYDLEQSARDVVLSLLRLAGDRSTLILCFDEVEAMLTGAADTAALRAFATLAVDLIAEPGAKVVVTFIRPETFKALSAAVELANVKKLSQSEAVLPALERWEQVVRVVLGRLQAEPLVKAARAAQPDKFWPLDEPFVRRLFEANPLALTPRHLLKACQVEFERLRDGMATVPLPPPDRRPAPHPDGQPAPPPPPPPPDTWELVAKRWEKRAAHHRTHLHALNWDTLFGLGLPWLAAAADTGFEPAGPINPRLPDVSLVFISTSECFAVGVALCHQDPRTLWRRLDKLVGQSQAAKAHGLLGRLAVLRPAALPLSDAAEQRLDKLRRGGAVICRPDDQTVAGLAAYQELLHAIQLGKATDYGKPLDPAEYRTWAAGHLTPAVRRLAADLFGPPAPAATDPPVKRQPATLFS